MHGTGNRMKCFMIIRLASTLDGEYIVIEKCNCFYKFKDKPGFYYLLLTQAEAQQSYVNEASVSQN